MTDLSTIERSTALATSAEEEPPRRFALMPRWGVLLVVLLVQIVASLAISNSSVLGLAHAVGLLVIGLYAVLSRDLPLTLCTIAYLTGSEVMWRQATVPIPYLAAPYILILLSVFAVLFVIRHLGRDARLALLYIALLLPASINTIRTIGPGSREAIAFALSGPIGLAAFIAFTSQVKAAPWLYRRVLWTTVVAAVGPLTVAISRLRTDFLAGGGVGIDFEAESNFATSGGFGPVQVSSMLSLGVLAVVLLLLSEPNRIARVIAGVVGLALLVQTLLTFSRGGSFSVVIAVVVLALARSTDRRSRRRIVGVAAAVIVVCFLFVFPWLEDFTGGKFEERFSDASSSRTELAANDAEIFRSNILLGVGPGMTKYQRLTYEVCQLRSDDCKDEASSHTEFTRMLGEHGIPGVAALVVLAVLASKAYLRKGAGRAFGFAFLAWAIAQMFYANLRITAVPFAFGMAFLRMTDRGDGEDADEDAAGAQQPPELHGPDTSRADRPIGFGAGYSADVLTGSVARPAGSRSTGAPAAELSPTRNGSTPPTSP
jgi:hypothetical protein